MSKKQDTASALAGILKAKRSNDHATQAEAFNVTRAEPELPPPPSPALPPPSPRVETATMEPAKAETATLKGRGGKSSDPNYNQYSVYLRKAVRKKVGRALDDADNGTDFSDLVEELLEKWLKSRT
jgi:hypothetical protein